ncbi:Mitochondrial outer membrane protein iml2 [Orbilia brochopaga]|uniref:Inclusion body clearance protein IML2 n=1 Tax=Orbilia brochopaga TaxID=3140254 RepID=A0AAV9U506_9PEZI
MFKLFSSRAPSPAVKTPPPQPVRTESSISLSGLDEQADIVMVLRAMDHVMDDNLEAAESELDCIGTSPWHKLGIGAIGFIRSAAGFEQAVMKEAGETLAAAETAAHNAQRSAVRSPRSTSSYPAGTEFALANAEAQLMAAVIGVLSESIVEAMKAFYKMRSAFKTLEGVSKVIEEVKATKAKNPTGSTNGSINGSMMSSANGSAGSLVKGGVATSRNQQRIPRGPMESNGTSVRFPNAVDEYIESGGNLCYGTLLLFIGMIPPAMSKLLSVLGFHGDRRKGIERLWESANMMNSHGALAALILLTYYNILEYCDIVQTDETKGGVPKRKCEALLMAYREKYPNSPLWILEEARLCSQRKDLVGAVKLLEFDRKPQMKQIEAICVFEKALDAMCMHEYQHAAELFVHLVDLNSWSDAMYLYIAGSCYVELYRGTVTTNRAKAEEYAKKAQEHLLKVSMFLGKKKFMARALPLEVFADRKVKKWQKFASARKCSLVEAVGVSPVEEMIYLWNGYARMNQEYIDVSVRVLEWQPPNDGGKPKSCITELDEKVLLAFMKAVLARHQGDLERSRQILEKEVIPVDKNLLKAEDWVAPSAQYEMAAVIWAESGIKEAAKITEYLNKCAGWESYELDNRLGVRATTALDVIRQSQEAEKVAAPA